MISPGRFAIGLRLSIGLCSGVLSAFWSSALRLITGTSTSCSASLRPSIRAMAAHRTTAVCTIVGGVASPILSNIYLHELDEFMAEMRAGFDLGRKRRANPAYAALTRRIHKLRREIDALRAAGAGEALIRPSRDEIGERQRERRSVPAVDPMDPGFRRLRYCRYSTPDRHYRQQG